MASTRRPPMDSVPMMVCTHSYRMAFPALRAPSVLVATWHMSQPGASPRTPRKPFKGSEGAQENGAF